MKILKFIPIIALLTACLSCLSQSPQRIEIATPTVEQEASSVWRTINDIAFFEQQGYTVNLPEDPIIDSLISKSRNGAFGNDDFSTIYTLIETKIFDSANYEKAIQNVENNLDLVNDLVDRIYSERSEWDWDFKIFDTYKVVFTLYGTGGSYDPDQGIITLFTNTEGGFMNYQNPANTIIHEITHMGMEYSLVQKHNLPHGLKERVVDTFVFLLFKENLPEYQIQNMGDPKIDNHLKSIEDIRSLGFVLSEFTKK